METPNDKEVSLIAEAVIFAAQEKAKELGYRPILGFVGIEHAYRSFIVTMKIFDALGPELTEALGKELMKAQARNTINEAEEILKEES